MPATASAIISVRSHVHSSGTGLILQLLQGKSAFTLPVLRVISRFQNLLVVRYTVASIRDSKRVRCTRTPDASFAGWSRKIRSDLNVTGFN